MWGGVVLGLYVGVWVCFIGGIIDLITEIRAENFEPVNIGWGIVKMMFACVCGWLSALVLILPGLVFCGSD